MSERSNYLIYDRDSYAEDGKRAPPSIYGVPDGPRFGVVRYIIGRAPYALGQYVESAAARTIDEARAMVPPGCVCTPRGPQHTGMVPVEAWACDGDGGPLRRLIEHPAGAL